MTKQAPYSPPLKVTLERWLEDRAAELSLTHKQLADKAGMTSYKLTQCHTRPEFATAAEVHGLADALNLHWYDDLVSPWGFGKRAISLGDADELASSEGFVIGLIVNYTA